MGSDRLLVVSNRLPVSARLAAEGIRIVPSAGGLATGLRPWHERSNGVWFGWPGDVSSATPGMRDELDRASPELRASCRCICPHDQVSRYYDGFSNGVLWPLFHYLLDRVPLDATGMGRLRAVNERFAEAVARNTGPATPSGCTTISSCCCRRCCASGCPDARIGFFLHIPFPASEVFRIAAVARADAEGLLGADLVGFHTSPTCGTSLASLLHVVGVERDVERVRVGGARGAARASSRWASTRRSFAALAARPRGRRRVRDAFARTPAAGASSSASTGSTTPRASRGACSPSSGCSRRIPSCADGMRLIQVAVPVARARSRRIRIRAQVEEAVGRINGAFGTLSSAPVHYIHRSVPRAELVALYRAADVMLVTPLRDGMNLVAKEFVASRMDDDGVLVLERVRRRGLRARRRVHREPVRRRRASPTASTAR